MKVTVTILDKNIKGLEKFTTKLISMTFIVTLVLTFAFCIRYIKVSPDILKLSTNFRQAEKFEISIVDLFIGSIPALNSNNYSINEAQKSTDKILTNNNNKTEIDLIDDMVNEKRLNELEVLKKSELENLTIKNTDNLQRINVYDMSILNYSSNRNFDLNKLFSKVINLTKSSDKILLYNTHTSESYINSEKYKFEYSGTARSQDEKYNMINIAKEFEKNLSEKSISVYQDTTPHDYGTYTSAYLKSRTTVKSVLAKTPGIGLSIDVHRDAAADLAFRPVVDINGVQVAKLMFVIGVGTNTSKNEYWEENLSLAVQLQKIADEIYPGLFRPMIVRNSVYNQDLNKFSFLIEVGATGNTIDEAMLATRCLSNILNIIYKN